MNPEQYCMQKAAPPGSTNYYSTLFHPPREKRGLLSLLALYTELNDTLRECQDPGVARIKFQWWREELQRLEKGEARHPVSREIELLNRETKLEYGELFNIVDSVEARVSPNPAASYDSYIREQVMSGTSFWSCGAIWLDVGNQEHRETILELGAHLNFLDILENTGNSIHRGYCPYPLMELNEVGLDLNKLMDESLQPERLVLHQSLAAKVARSLSRILREESGLSRPSLRFINTAATIKLAICARIEKGGNDLLNSVTTISPLRKLWLSWTCNRKIRS